MQYRQVFISHSNEDRKIVDFFVRQFQDSGIKPVLMEYEGWSRNGEPNWVWIRKEIERSDAVFVILTKGVVAKPHTQNWIAFEIGLAAGCKPPKPVVVFREEDIIFPLPYLDHYCPHPMSSLQDIVVEENDKFVKALHAFLTLIINKVILEFAKNPSIPLNRKVECYTCLTKFYYWGNDESFACPCCSSMVSKG